jgi:crotonobetainyl-CoA hydratase
MMDAVRVTRSGPVLEVTLDRPKANAIDAATSRNLSDVFLDFRDDASLRVAIFTGGGDRFFSAGWDLASAADGEMYEADYGEGGFGGFVELPDLNKPVICAVNGMAVGGGFELALAGDLVVSADHAMFFLPETSLGIVPDAASVRLPRLLPKVIANEILLAGRRLDAQEALRWGLVNVVVPGGEVLDVARELASRVVAAAPLAVGAVLEIDRRTGHLGLDAAFSELRSGTMGLYEQMLVSEDAAEGPNAFADKRDPIWKGH